MPSWTGTAIRRPMRSSRSPASSACPTGLHTRDGSLYVAEVSRILRFDNIVDRLYNPPKPVIVSKAFPSDRHHGWKYIAFGPDGFSTFRGGAVQCVRKERRAVRLDHADEADGRTWRSSPQACGTPWLRLAPGNEGTCGSRTTAGTGWVTIGRRRVNQAPEKGMHFGSHTATATSWTPPTGSTGTAASTRPRP